SPYLQLLCYSSSPSTSSLHFSFYSSHALRDLHSFPTRRSSDLATASPVFPGSSFPMIVSNTGPKATFGTESAENTWSQRSPLVRDRKSTRLNSSHVSISYAVFCLKKKNNS